MLNKNFLYITKSQFSDAIRDRNLFSFQALETKDKFGTYTYLLRVTLITPLEGSGVREYLLVNEHHQIVKYSSLKNLRALIVSCGHNVKGFRLSFVPFFAEV